MGELVVTMLMRKNMSTFQKKVWKLLGEDENPWGFFPEIPLHGFIADFYAPDFKVIIEADGPHHAMLLRRSMDYAREEILLKHGIKTMHITPAMFVTMSTKDLLDYIDGFMRSTLEKENEEKVV